MLLKNTVCYGNDAEMGKAHSVLYEKVAQPHEIKYYFSSAKMIGATFPFLLKLG